MNEAYRLTCYTDKEALKKCDGKMVKQDDGSYILTIDSDNFEYISPLYNTKIINGEIENKKFFTNEFYLLEYGPENEGGKKFWRCKYKVYRYYIGCNYFEENDILVNKLVCHFNNLDAWMHGFGLFCISDTEHLESLIKNGVGKIQVDSYKINDELTIEVQTRGTGLYNFHEQNSIIIKKNNATVFELLDIANKLAKLLSLFCFTEIETQETMHFMGDSYKNIFLEGKQWVFNKILYASNIIDYQQIKPYFKSIFTNYIKASKKVKSAIDMICSSFYYSISPGASINEFLSVAKAIESIYDSEIINFEEQEKKKKEEITALIKSEQISSKTKKLLKDALRGEFKVQFQERLKQFFKDNIDNLSQSTIRSIDNLSMLIADTRNYYTHLDKKEGKRTIDELDLHIITLSLRIFCINIILKHLSNGYDSWKQSIVLMARNTLENYCCRNKLEDIQ